MKNSIIIGAGTYGQVYASYFKEAGINIIGYIDDNIDLIGKEINGVPILGKYEDLFDLKFKNKIQDIYCPIGVNSIRTKYLSTLKNEGYGIPNFLHHSVSIGPNVNIGEAVYVLVGSIVMPYVTIGDFTMISMGGNVAHHVDLREGVFISAGVNVGASIDVGRNAFFGIGSTVMTGVKKIGEYAMIGAGAVVIKDVPDYTTVVGNPAKTIKTLQSEIK
ncbi:NeuD/PglB/VioB family sugar acetyltransferase [Aquimarina macrocephali]|uniref:NeuD/PglB/VioB family sugar acetyltransferase n=1 Tax=Aquimarina macrocephali TaxID=666563 RepID=UPI0004641755|nr:NeuD/PglB/VioB family sugar acetyltransferase [Aquimarina macrocephali]